MPEGALRRRNAHGVAHGYDEEVDDDQVVAIDREPQSSAWRHNFESVRWWFLVILQLTALAGVVYQSVKIVVWIIPRIEQPLEAYPTARAWVFNPLRSFEARFLDPSPTGILEFKLTSENAFVINLDRDVRRMETFALHNKPAYPNRIQRFPAHEWAIDEEATPTFGGLRHSRGSAAAAATETNSTRASRVAIQEAWQRKYPFLADSVRAKKYGDAACSLSHVRLWEQYLSGEEDSQEYLFVFEDDAELDPSLKETLYILAPDSADLIFLAAPAIKRLEVPWGNMVEEVQYRKTKEIDLSAGSRPKATRVLGGYGAWGYIITRSGAHKLLDYLSKSSSPADVSFFEAPGLQIYLPIDLWPAVHHSKNTRSTRLGNNHS